MILKSEGDKIKLVQGPPAREKKYAIIAYSQILQEACQQIPDEVITIVVRSLIELCAASGQNNGFQLASTVATDTEDLLVDGAIDQTFAFQRSQFVPLSAAKIELSDKLEQEVPQPEVFFLSALQQVAGTKTKGDMGAFVGGDQKNLRMLQELTQFFGAAQ